MKSVPTYELKIILLGDTGVGKSTLLKRLVSNVFDPNATSTVGCDYCTTVVNYDAKRVDVTIWDTAGQERFRSLTRMYYSDTNIAFLVFNLNDPKTFDEMKLFHTEVVNANEGPILPVIIGTHLDMVDRETSDIMTSGIVEEYAAEIGAAYFQVSCSNDNIASNWTKILQSSVIKYITEINKNLIAQAEHSDVATQEAVPDKKKCC